MKSLSGNRRDRNYPERAALKIYEEYWHFYREFLKIADLAKQSFEERDFNQSVNVSARRLSLYSESFRRVAQEVADSFPALCRNEDRWQDVEIIYKKLTQGQYAEDVALAYLHSLRRNIYAGEWRSADYSSVGSGVSSEVFPNEVVASWSIDKMLSSKTVVEILNIPGFTIRFKHLEECVNNVIGRVSDNIAKLSQGDQQLASVEIIRGGFYRNRGAYIVGRMTFEDGSRKPLIVALLNSSSGVYVDAVLTSETYTHNIFSSTLANFHVTNSYYHHICAFLHSIMPKRPLGLHYSTIGYNHLGKITVMRELEDEWMQSRSVFEDSVGSEGTVAMGFSSKQSAYHLKVIRNSPTKDYKWGSFDGIESVIRKYTRVHEINRVGSMLDSIIYYNVSLDKRWFSPELLKKIQTEASDTVSVGQDFLVFKHLIVQIKLTPLPVYLETATQKQAETAMVNLGYCIKNNAAANIYNKDLDARNYGVGSFSKIYLFDYDALEDLTDVKIRTNLDREYGEEDIPDWYFEDGVVFLPEEIASGLCISNRYLRTLFQDRHASLLTTGYWEDVQQDLLVGTIPSTSVYPDSERVDAAGS